MNRNGRKPVLFVNGLKPCSKCKQCLPRDKFRTSSSTKSGYYNQCQECCRTNLRAWYVTNRDHALMASKRVYENNKRRSRHYHLKKEFGISIDEYERMVCEQSSRCLICGYYDSLVVDHNHKSGKIRGLLCHGCNKSLGLMRENPQSLRKAAEYLENNA